MRKNVNIENWRLAWMENATVRDNALNFTCAADIEKNGCRVIDATVPGSYEIDFMREGLLDDVYMGTNTVQTQRYENLQTGECALEANGIAKVGELPDVKCGFYLIRWKTENGEGMNHFVCNIGENWTYEKYKACMEKAGFYNEFEGF